MGFNFEMTTERFIDVTVETRTVYRIDYPDWVERFGEEPVEREEIDVDELRGMSFYSETEDKILSADEGWE